MKHPLHNRILALVLAAVMVLGHTCTVRAASTGLRWAPSEIAVSADLTDRLVENTRTPSEYRSTDTVRVSIVLDKKSTLQAGFSTISIAKNDPALAYNAGLQAAQRTLAGQISARALDGAKLDVVWNMTLVGNIISANVPYGKIEAIQAVEGVSKVVLERQYSLTETAGTRMSSASAMTGAATVWTSGYTGAGSRVAVIDTGTDTDHQSFDNDAYLYALARNARNAGVSEEEYIASLDLLDATEIESVLDQLNVADRVGADAADYYISEKLPFGANYVDHSLDVTHDNDAQGSHGSHVAGIAAANRYIPGDEDFVDAMEAAGMTGVAPDAQIITLKVFGNAAGPYDSDYFAAIEDAIWLGADSVNLSLGTANPGTSYNDVYADLLEYLETTDTVVVMSAGNSGYWARYTAPGYLYTDDVNFATGGAPGSYHSALAVGSVENDGTEENHTMNDFSSWGVPGDLSLKPELTAPGGSIRSIDGMDPSGTGYETLSGTSMAAPQVSGMVALLAEYIRDKGLAETTGLSPRHLAQSLLMSTAQPMREDGENYYALMQQGAGLARVDLAAAAQSYLLVEGTEDGKVKAELGEDADRTGIYRFSFDIHNFSSEAASYALSADLFTQDILLGKYLDTGTRPLAGTAVFKVNGVTMEAVGEEYKCDLNGDGVTDEGDADFLLEYLLGNAAEVCADADVNGDGSVTSCDAHVLLTRLGGGAQVEVPAGDSVTVEVTLTLTESARALLDEHYPSGAYVEAFVYAAGADVTHSIPVLGFYGSWSEPGMYDVGSFLEHLSGRETRTPYLYRYHGTQNNFLTIDFGDGTEYIFGGNPVVDEAEYLPRRNAFNNKNGAILSGLYFGLIRNAAASKLVIENAETGEIYLSEELGEIESAYYHVNTGSWQNTRQAVWLDWDAAGLDEGTVVDVSLVTAPELYRVCDAATGAYTADWSKVREGGYLTTRFTVDNTEPQVLDVALDSEDATVLNVTARDNQYIAAVAVLNSAGTGILAVVPANQTEPDTQTTVQLDLSQIFGSEFLVAVYDYAGNASAYEVTLELENQRPYFTAIDRSSLCYVGMETDGSTVTLAEISGRTGPRAAAYVGGRVYEITDDNQLYVGTDADLHAFTHLCDLDPDNAWNIRGFNDLAYNGDDGRLYGLFYSGRNNLEVPYLCTIDLHTGEMTVLGAMPIDASSMAIDGEGNFYSAVYGTGKLYTYTADVADTQCASYVGTMGSYSTTAINSMAWDHNTDTLYWACSSNNRTYFLQVDPATAAVEYLCYYPFATAGLYIPWDQGAAAAAPMAAVSPEARSDISFAVPLPDDAANGTMTITYDPAALALVGAASSAPAFAYAAGDGSVALAFASRETLPADSDAAVLTFTAKTSGVTDLTVTTGELNDGTLDQEQTFSITLGKVVASGWSGYTTWELDDNGLLTFSGEGAMKNYTTKTAMPWYDYRDRIKAVVLESGITTIGSYAFYGMPAMEEIRIPDTVTNIGEYAFKNSTALEVVELPDGLTQLGESAFYGCTGLTAIEIPASLWTVRPYTFKNCTALASVTFHEGNLQKISDAAFYNTALRSVALPDCLDILDVFVFKNCTDLASVTLGSGLTEIREAAFYGTALPAIEIPEGITGIGPYAFKNCAALESVSLPDSLRSIGESAFFGCTGLTGMTLPEGVTAIGGYAFKRCTGLAAVSLPDSLASIGDSAFHTCTALTAVTVPENVETLGEYCFSASGLKEITFTGDAPAIGAGAFNKVTATAFYPGGNAAWTADIMQNYGGTITWTAV